MTTSTRTRRPGHNAVKGKQGFQETEKSVSALRLDDMRADLGTEKVNAVSRDLNASRAYDLRWDTRRALFEAANHPDARTDRAQAMRVAALAEAYTLLNDEDIPVEEAWNRGGVDAARFVSAGGQGQKGHLPADNDMDPLLAERRDAIGEHLLNKALKNYEENSDGEVVMFYGKDGDRDAYIEAAVIAMNDNGQNVWTANEIKSILDREHDRGNDPRNLDVKELLIQARTTVTEKKGAANCRTCGTKTVFDADYGYSHCPTCD